jgi:hypothetical protein
MISLLRVSEDGHGLVLSYPWWIAVAFALLALALAAYAVVRRRRMPRAWPATIAVVVAAWTGIYVATFRTTVDDAGGSAYAFLRYDQAVRWKDAVDIYLEQRGSGQDWQIVVIGRDRRSHNFDVAELSADDRDRVMAYMVDRMPASAFDRPPELLRRRAASGPRTMGLFPDQQI